MEGVIQEVLMKTAIPVLGMAILLAGYAAVGASKAPTAPSVLPNTVVIDNFTFTPQTLTVTAGTTVTWINRDDVPHTVASAGDPKILKSGVLDTDGTFQFTFTAPGRYSYFCTVHPHMKGTVVVQ